MFGRKLTATVLLSGAIGTQALANAPCGLSSPGGKPGVFTISGYDTPSFSPSVPVGTVIDSRQVSVQQVGSSVYVSCTGPEGAKNVFNGNLTKTTNPTYNTYPTTVEGVGVRLRYVSANDTGWWPFAFNTPVQTVTQTVNPLLIEFVKTGPITAQGFLAGELAGTYVHDRQIQMASYRVSGRISITPRVPTCSVAQSSRRIPVEMGTITSHEVFRGVDSTSPERPFNIRLNCEGGDPDTSTNVHVTLTDATTPGNTSDRLTLSGSSSASGMKVQVLFNGTPLSFGPDSSAAGNLNQWKAGNVPQGLGVFNIPLTARYIQTAPTITGGNADALATFTMSYQ